MENITWTARIYKHGRRWNLEMKNGVGGGSSGKTFSSKKMALWHLDKNCKHLNYQLV